MVWKLYKFFLNFNIPGFLSFLCCILLLQCNLIKEESVPTFLVYIFYWRIQVKVNLCFKMLSKANAFKFLTSCYTSVLYSLSTYYHLLSTTYYHSVLSAGYTTGTGYVGLKSVCKDKSTPCQSVLRLESSLPALNKAEAASFILV